MGLRAVENYNSIKLENISGLGASKTTKYMKLLVLKSFRLYGMSYLPSASSLCIFRAERK